MRPIFLTVLVALAVSGCSQSTDQKTAPTKTPLTLTSFDKPSSDEQPIPAHSITFKDAPLDQVLDLYASTSHRSVIRGENLPAAKFTFSNELPLTPVKVLQALDTLLAVHGIVTVPQGTDYVKVLTERDAIRETPPILTGSPDQLPDSSSFVSYAMEVKSDQSLMQAITPFSHLPNSIIFIPGDHASAAAKTMPLVNEALKALGPKPHAILILRDYSSNVRKMLQVAEKVQAGNR